MDSAAACHGPFEAVRAGDLARFVDAAQGIVCAQVPLGSGFGSNVALRPLPVLGQIEGAPSAPMRLAPRAGADTEWRGLVCDKFVYTHHQC